MLTILVSIFAFIYFSEGSPIFDIYICDSPVKNQACLLTCRCPENNNVIFHKRNGAISGEGVCYLYGGCNTTNKRYSLFRNQRVAHFYIPYLRRKQDQDYWFCVCGLKQSPSKKLTVLTKVSSLTIGPVPTDVKNAFILTAVGYCVYPKMVSAKLLPSHGTSNHRPTINYSKDPRKCDSDEYNISISFNIKPRDFNGDVAFQVEVEGDNVKPFVSDSSNLAHFPVSNADSTYFALYIGIISAILFVVIMVSAMFWYIQRRRSKKRNHSDSQGSADDKKWVEDIHFPGSTELSDAKHRNADKEDEKIQAIYAKKERNLSGSADDKETKEERNLSGSADDKKRVEGIYLATSTKVSNLRKRDADKGGKSIQAKYDETDPLVGDEDNHFSGSTELSDARHMNADKEDEKIQAIYAKRRNHSDSQGSADGKERVEDNHFSGSTELSDARLMNADKEDEKIQGIHGVDGIHLSKSTKSSNPRNRDAGKGDESIQAKYNETDPLVGDEDNHFSGSTELSDARHMNADKEDEKIQAIYAKRRNHSDSQGSADDKEKRRNHSDIQGSADDKERVDGIHLSKSTKSSNPRNRDAGKGDESIQAKYNETDLLVVHQTKLVLGAIVEH